ncbi:MAG: cellulase family glycosylhydrolase [Bacilli bacterium]|nr:cellulase family glycosylhydrolase [Bacilli bacterium]MBN2696029.1 cellulase family glycosylhydrolase [Bacilli bacterium]
MRGVNLGGWLVLERWMTPELFSGYNAPDEYHLLLERQDALSAIKQHRNDFICESDFAWISSHGLDSVRIPVGHWLFEDIPPYMNAKQELDQAFRWAHAYNLNVLVDIHAAKGCQNGFDNGGLSGVCEWHKSEANIQDTLNLIKRICSEYATEPAFAGIELLNEPHQDISLELLQDFYKKGYDIVRNAFGKDKYVVFHDAFRWNQWKPFFKNGRFENVYLDTHMYHVFGELKQDANMFDLYDLLLDKRLRQINEIKEHVRLIIGEWSVPLTDNLLSKHQGTDHDLMQKVLGGLSSLVFNQADGWFFWNYKLSEQSAKSHQGWDYRRLFEDGYSGF